MTCYGVFGRNWSTELTCALSQEERILNIFEIGYEIHMSLNFSFCFGGIILILFNIRPVWFIILDHIVSVMFTSQMISSFMKHPIYMCVSVCVLFWHLVVSLI